MTHRYIAGRATIEEGFVFGEMVVEGDFDVRTVDGHARPVIVTRSGLLMQDSENDIFDCCVDDCPIPLWVNRSLVYTHPFGPVHLFEEPGGVPEPPRPVDAVLVPQYVFIRSELRAGHPHPGAEGPER